MSHDIDGFRFLHDGVEYGCIALPAGRARLRLDTAGLTESERVVAELVCGGLSNKEVACARGCSPATVSNQLASIYRKLEVHTRTELILAINGGTTA